jgi:hypothetical protein
LSSTATSLVLGAVSRFPPTAFEPFVHSLRASGYEGRVGLVSGHYEPTARQELLDLADFVVDASVVYANARNSLRLQVLRTIRQNPRLVRFYKPAFKLLLRAVPERLALQTWQELEFYLEGLQALRYGYYYDILQGIGRNADVILLTDVRDVIFQSDPFDIPVESLELFLEDRAMTFATNVYNREWIRLLYGPAAVKALGDRTVSCSGTVVGRREDVLGYLREMCEAICWRRTPLGSLDQGVHNYLLAQSRFPGVKVVPNGFGRVITVGGMDHVSRSQGFVMNTDGTLPAIVHQYDRHADLVDELPERFARPAGGASSRRRRSER